MVIVAVAFVVGLLGGVLEAALVRPPVSLLRDLSVVETSTVKAGKGGGLGRHRSWHLAIRTRHSTRCGEKRRWSKT